MNTDTFVVFMMAAVLLAVFALSHDFTCKPNDPSFKIGNAMLLAGCK